MEYIVKQKTYQQPGRMTWQPVRVFDDPAEADEWLTAWIRVNGFAVTDFNIVAKEA